MISSSMITTSATEGSSLEVEGGAVVPVADNVTADKTCARVVFDDTRGKLTFVLNNGEVIEAVGFPTAAQIGAGPTGKRGRVGATGRNGRDGRDGATGTTGCDGCVGPTGPTGPDGDDGEDGPDGPTGPIGDLGPTGEAGPTGNAGPTGPDGVLGPRGACCLTGPTGPTGPRPKSVVTVTKTLPTAPEIFAIFMPQDPNNPVRPSFPTFTDVKINLANKKVNANLFEGTMTYVAGFYVEAAVSGGSSKLQYVWTLPVVNGVSFTQSGAKLRVDFSKRKPEGLYAGEVFTVALTVTDLGRTDTPSVNASAEIRIKV